MSSLVEVAETLRHQVQGVQDKLQSMKKAKFSERGQLANKYQKQCKRVKNLLQSYLFTIQDSQKQNGIQTHKSQYQQFKARLDKVQTGIQYQRNAGASQQELFKHRNVNTKQKNMNQRSQMIQIGHQTQQKGAQALKRVIKNVHQMDQQADSINLQLDRQIEQLDKIYNDLKDTDTTLKRAQKHLKYFARQIYTDRLMICLIIFIIIAIIVIIVLSAIGKTPKIQVDGLK